MKERVHFLELSDLNENFSTYSLMNYFNRKLSGDNCGGQLPEFGCYYVKTSNLWGVKTKFFLYIVFIKENSLKILLGRNYTMSNENFKNLSRILTKIIYWYLHNILKHFLSDFQ